MIKKEMCGIMNEIGNFYSNFEVTEEKVVAWQSVLYFVKADDFRYALIKYVKNENFPPTIASLLDYWCGNNFDKSKDKAGD